MDIHNYECEWLLHRTMVFSAFIGTIAWSVVWQHRSYFLNKLNMHGFKCTPSTHCRCFTLDSDVTVSSRNVFSFGTSWSGLMSTSLGRLPLRSWRTMPADVPECHTTHQCQQSQHWKGWESMHLYKYATSNMSISMILFGYQQLSYLVQNCHKVSKLY